MSFANHHVMSRAFVNEDAGQWGNPGRRFDLPDRDDPGFDRAAAEAMLRSAGYEVLEHPEAEVFICRHASLPDLEQRAVYPQTP